MEKGKLQVWIPKGIPSVILFNQIEFPESLICLPIVRWGNQIKYICCVIELNIHLYPRNPCRLTFVAFYCGPSPAYSPSSSRFVNCCLVA